MGLDMYLTRKKYIGAEYEHRNVEANISIKIGGKEIPIDIKKISYIEEAVAYWRKANAIHNWFVNNIQEGEDDCKEYYVSTEDLQKLLDLCKEVKEKAILVDGDVASSYSVKDGEWVPNLVNGKIIQNAEEIAKILPTQEGFFFGNTDYNEYYMDDIENTIRIIEEQIEREKELKEMNIYTYLEYSSSW